MNPETIRTGWLIDGSGGPVRENILIEIVGGRLGRIRDTDHGADGAPVFRDFSGCTVLPGLIDSHVHLFMSGTADRRTRDRQQAAGFDTAQATIARNLSLHRACGVVAVRDGGDGRGLALRYKETCLKSSQAPMTVKVAGRAWRASGRYGRLIGRAPADHRTLAEAVAADGSGIDHVKIVNSGLNSLVAFGRQTPCQFDLSEMAGAVAAAGCRGLRVMVHANGEAPVRMAVEAGCHSVEHGFFMGEENLLRLADRRVVWVPTACTMKAYADAMDPAGPERDVCLKNLDHQLDQMRKARDLGVTIALGTDAGSMGVHHGSGVREELGLLMTAGYPVEEAVRCASANGAALLGIGDAGRLFPGCAATFVAVNGPPSALPDSLGRIEAICIQGRWMGAEDRGLISDI